MVWWVYLNKGGEGRMNQELVNNRISQLPIAMAGIVHDFTRYARGLSIYPQSVSQFAKRHLP
jgi:hypothetical protein